MQVLLIIILLAQCRHYLKKGKPHPELYFLKHQSNQWSIIDNEGIELFYNELVILIHNPLFQLLKLSINKKNKLVILFNDQLPNHQLRLLHLKTGKY